MIDYLGTLPITQIPIHGYLSVLADIVYGLGPVSISFYCIMYGRAWYVVFIYHIVLRYIMNEIQSLHGIRPIIKIADPANPNSPTQLLFKP